MGLENGARKVVKKMRRTADAFGGGFLDMTVQLLAANLPRGPLPFLPGALFLPMVTVWYLLAEIGSIMGKHRRYGAAPMPRVFQKEHRNHAKLYFNRQKRNRQTQEIGLFQNATCKRPGRVV